MPDFRTWKATKAELHKGRWRASRDRTEVSYSSRIISDAVIAVYARALKAHAGGVLIDLGCGKAPYFGIYRDFVTKSIGVDWDTSIHETDQIDVKCDLNEGIALPDACADTVLCTDVLEHIFEPGRTWSEMARVLQPGGSAIVGVPFFYWIHEAPFDYHRYTSFALRRYAENAGLTVDSLEAVGGLPHVLADMLCKSVRSLRPAILQLPVVHICRIALGMLVRKPTRADTPFPLHYVVVARKPELSAPD